MKAGIGVIGTLKFTVKHVDGTETIVRAKNIITTRGLTALATGFSGGAHTPISGVMVGHGTTAAVENDTHLEASYPGNKAVGTTHLTGTDSHKVEFTAQWALGEIVGDVTEAGLYMAGNMFNRSVFTAVPLTATDLLVLKWTIEFKNV